MQPAEATDRRVNPSLWDCQAEKQINITMMPTHYGETRSESTTAEKMLETRGQFHLCRTLRTSSQRVAMAYTEEPCMGGRAWNTIDASEGVAKALAIYLNSTYGLVVRMGYGASTIQGRSPIQVRAIDGHPAPDFSDPGKAGENARRIAREHFDSIRRLPLNRIALSLLDPNRAEIDRVATLMLGLPWTLATESMLHEWRRLFCLQPGVNGGTKSVLKELAKAGYDRP